MFLQIVGECFTHSLVHSTHHLTVTELRLGLTLKLRFCHLHADYGSETFTEVFTRDFNLRLFNLLLSGLFCILLQHTRHRRAETSKVSTSFDGVDIVDVRVEIFRITSVVDNRHFYRDAFLLRVDVDHIRDKWSTHRILVAHKLAQTLF